MQIILTNRNPSFKIRAVDAVKKNSSPKALFREGSAGVRSQVARVNRLWSIRMKMRRIPALSDGKKRTAKLLRRVVPPESPVPLGDQSAGCHLFAFLKPEQKLYIIIMNDGGNENGKRQEACRIDYLDG